MFAHHDETGWKEVLPGILMKTTVWGDKTLMTLFRLAGGSTLPLHRHDHEQTGYLVSGHMILRVGDDTVEVHPGDSWSIPGNVEHGAEVRDEAVAVEVFAPVREEYIPVEKR